MASLNGATDGRTTARQSLSVMCTDSKMEEMAAAMKAVADAAKADKARQEWLESEIQKQTSRANASELEKAALQDRVQQLEVALEEQGTKAALAWKWQQEVARLQEKLGKRSVELLAKEQELTKVKVQLKEITSEASDLKERLKETKEKLEQAEEAHKDSREAHQQDVSDYKDRLGKANERISEVEEAYEDLREQASAEIHDLRCKLAEMSDKLSVMSGKLKDTNEKLNFTLAARAESRKKYNNLAEQLLLLSRSAAAACSSGGGAPASVAGDSQSPFEGFEADKAVMLPQLNSTIQQRHGAYTTAGLTNSKNCGMHTSPMHALDSGKSQADFMPSLDHSGTTLVACESNSGASVTSTASKGGGMLSKLKTTSLASSISAMLSSSPRDKKKGALSKKQQRQTAGDTDGSGKPPKAPIGSSSAQYTSSRSEARSEAPYKLSYRTSDPFVPSCTEQRAQRERAYTTCSVTDGTHGLVRTTSSMSATAAMISAYHPGANHHHHQQQQKKQQQQQLEQSLKLASAYIAKQPLQTPDEYYEDCGSASDCEAVASHFVTLEDCASESPV